MTKLEISGSVRNLKTLMDALALPRSNKSSGSGDNLAFEYRKVVIKPDYNGLLIARQVSSSIYSQVVVRSDVETPFLNIRGDGDLILDMGKALKRVKELMVYDTASIIHDTETKRTVYRGFKSDTDYEEWGTFEPTKDIDDARNVIPSRCGCTDPSACTKCNGRGVVPVALTHTSPISSIGIIAPRVGGTPYPKIGVQFDINTSVMRTIGDKTEELLDDAYPMQFNEGHLLVFAGTPDDISNDDFKKPVPVTYAINEMVGKVITLGTDFRNVFGSIEGMVTIQTEDKPINEQSIYVAKYDMGFHTGIKLEAKGRIDPEFEKAICDSRRPIG